MKGRFILFVFLLLFAVPSVPSVSYALVGFGGEVAIGVWIQGPAGNLSYKALLPTDDIDLESDFGYDDESRIMGRVKVELPLMLPDLYLVVTPMEFDGVGQKSVPFKFGDESFIAATNFTSKVKLDQYDLALTWGIPLLKTATLNKFNIDWGLNVRMIQLSSEINGVTALGLRSEKTDDVTVYLPMLYVAAQIQPVEWLGVEVEFRGVTINDNYYYDYIGRIKYNPIDYVFVAGGWRYQDLEIDEDDIIAKLTFSGPFVEAGFEF